MNKEYLDDLSVFLDALQRLVYSQTGYTPHIEVIFYNKTDSGIWNDTEGFGKLTYAVDDDPSSHCWRSNHNITVHK